MAKFSQVESPLATVFVDKLTYPAAIGGTLGLFVSWVCLCAFYGELGIKLNRADLSDLEAEQILWFSSLSD